MYTDLMNSISEVANDADVRSGIMEENIKTEIAEAEETIENETNSGDAAAMLVILSIATVGALVGIGAMKLGTKIRKKIHERRESKKADDDDGTEYEDEFGTYTT